MRHECTATATRCKKRGRKPKNRGSGGAKMKLSDNTSIILERRIISSTIVESKVLIGRDIINIRSTFDGDKRYSDILFELACRKLSA
jgi:hypothetical protein